LAVTAGGGTFGVQQLKNLTALTALVPPFGTAVSPAINALFRFHKGNVTWTGFLDALKENGLVKILAEPTLVTISGQEANFLAGGEFPVPIPQQGDTITIVFKTFGVGLLFTPTVLSEDKISMKVTPEVSELDFSNAVSFGGFVIPGLTTRRASTAIELADGQSFAIAGLLNENVRESVSKFPILGDIPILGALFRSSSFQKNETELVIIVTPHLVKPLDMTKQPLPTDPYIEPNDFEWYLMGQLEGRGRAAAKMVLVSRAPFGPRLVRAVCAADV
jgi:pilus assembly protein CpaC